MTLYQFKRLRAYLLLQNEGVMHACGHDAHTAYMLILGETLIEIKDQFKGKVIIIHQPAEEMPPGGAQGMIKDGVLDGVDHVLGAHVMSTMEAGKVFYREGFVQTGRAYFKLKVQGSGGHGSSPHMANDAIVAGAQFVTEVQTIVSRRLSPFETGVITIGSFDGKGQFNVIKDAVELEGDVRALTDDTRDTIEKELKRLVEGLESTFGVTCEFEFKRIIQHYIMTLNLHNMLHKQLKKRMQMIYKVLKFVNLNHLQRISLSMQRHCQVHLFIQALHLKMAKFIHITIQNSQLMNHQC